MDAVEAFDSKSPRARTTTTHEGITMKLMNSVLSPHIRSEYLIGINAQNTSRWRIHLMAVLKRLISLAWDSTSLVGNKFVQNLSPFPNETWSSTLRCELSQGYTFGRTYG